MRIATLQVLAVGLLTGFVGCRCTPATPQPVTLRIVNGGEDALYVDGTGGVLGLTVQREVGGEWHDFDDLACECRTCTRVCDASCSCPAVGPALVRRVLPGESAERTWDGVVRTSGVASCGDGACLDLENAPWDERFTVELCFTRQKPTGASFDDGGVALGSLRALAQDCVTKGFAPEDGLVEIGPVRGAACESDRQCPGADELCLGGSCTSGCPGNDFPEVGSAWNLLIPSPDNRGFFTRTPRGAGSILTGQGTLTSFIYAGTGLELHLSRVDPQSGERLTGVLMLTLPPGTGAPLETGAYVSVLVAEDGRKPQPGRGVVLRDGATRAVLFAADMAYQAPVLQPIDLQPLTVGRGEGAVGCRKDACGKFLYDTTTFAGGGRTLELRPGQTGDLTLPEGLYRFVDVTSGAWPTTDCDVSSMHPWLGWRQALP